MSHAGRKVVSKKPGALHLEHVKTGEFAAAIPCFCISEMTIGIYNSFSSDLVNLAELR